MRHLLLIVAQNVEPNLPIFLQSLRVNSLENISEILFIDDASTDNTAEIARNFFAQNLKIQTQVLKNNLQQGFGGNQKVGLRYAIDHHFDSVLVFYPQDNIPLSSAMNLIPFFESHSEAACILGTALSSVGGNTSSPTVKKTFNATFINSLLNKITGFHLPDWNTTSRLYSTRALKNILFELNTHQRHFDIEILLQLFDQKETILEYGLLTSSSRVDFQPDAKHLKDSFKAGLRYRFQRYHLFYDIRFHPELVSPGEAAHRHSVYREKKISESPHTVVANDAEWVLPKSRVLDIGCATGYVGDQLKQKKQCSVVGTDMLAAEAVSNQLDGYEQIDLEQNPEKIRILLQKNNFDTVLMLDVLEHLSFPELFLLKAFRFPMQKSPVFIFSTANVGFVVVRLMLLFGLFNYGTKGILDVTHKRLFTLRTFQNLMEQTGFLVVRRRFFPFPFDMVGLPVSWCGVLQKIHQQLIRLWPSMFAYQIMFEAVPLATPQKILEGLGKNEEKLTEASRIV